MPGGGETLDLGPWSSGVPVGFLADVKEVPQATVAPGLQIKRRIIQSASRAVIRVMAGEVVVKPEDHKHRFDHQHWLVTP